MAMILFSIVCDLLAIVNSRCLQIKYVQFDTSYGNLSHIFTRKCQRGYSLDQNPAWVHPSEEKGRVNKPRLPLMPAEPCWDGRCRDPRWQSLTRHDCLLTHRYRLRFWHHHLDFASQTRKMIIWNPDWMGFISKISLSITVQALFSRREKSLTA